jgi:hypothetical protein
MRQTVSMRKLLALAHTGELGPSKGIPTLMQWWGLCGHMIPRAMPMVVYATGRARHVKGDDPDKKGYTGPPGWGLGERLTNSPCKKNDYKTSKKQRRPRPTQG